MTTTGCGQWSQGLEESRWITRVCLWRLRLMLIAISRNYLKTSARTPWIRPIHSPPLATSITMHPGPPFERSVHRMAEPKDDPDMAHFVHKIANHLGNSRLEENLNDFLELHSEELRFEFHREGTLLEERGEPQQHEIGVGAQGVQEEQEQEQEQEEGGVGHEHAQNFPCNEFSQRAHELYQEFLRVVQANLEEFLSAEGLTEAQLRDACEREMQTEDPGGLSFMHTLITSWEFSSFVALVLDFVEEGSEPEDEQTETDDQDGNSQQGEWKGEQEKRLSGAEEEAAAALFRSRRDHGAASLGNGSGLGTEGGGCRSRCDRCLRLGSGSASTSEGSVCEPRCLTAADFVVEDAFKGQEMPVAVAADCKFRETYKGGATGTEAERHRQSGTLDGGVVASPEGVGSKLREGRFGGDAVGCCEKCGNKGSGEPRGREDLLGSQAGATGSNGRSRSQNVQQLSMRAQAKS